MTSFLLNLLVKNPYRILGLSCSATQAEIDRAARLLRIYDAATAAAGDRDAAWLGPLDRSPAAVEQAVMQLSAPDLRAQSRVWWFDVVPLERFQEAGASDVGMRETDTSAPSGPRQHDAALARLASLAVSISKTFPADVWLTIIRELSEAASSREYGAYLEAVEKNGDFEIVARPEEIANSQASLCGRVIDAVAETGRAAIERQEVWNIGQIMMVLWRAEQLAPEAALACFQEFVDFLDDCIVRHCHAWTQNIRTAWKTKKRVELMDACGDASKQCQRWVLFLLGAMQQQVGDGDRARMERIRFEILNFLELLCRAYEAVNAHWGVQKVMEWELEVAVGTSVEASIRAKLQRR